MAAGYASGRSGRSVDGSRSRVRVLGQLIQGYGNKASPSRRTFNGSVEHSRVHIPWLLFREIRV